MESRVIPESQCFRYLHKKGILNMLMTVNQRVAGSSHSDSVMADILASAPTYIDTLEFVESDTIPSFGMEAKI